MSDFAVPDATMDRRQLAKLMVMVSGGMALAPYAGAATPANTSGFEDGNEELRAFMKLQSRCDDGYTDYFNSGQVYAVIPGRAPVAMYGYEGLLRFHTRVVGPNSYEVTFIEAGTYLDLATGKRMDRFQRSPVTSVTRRPSNSAGRSNGVLCSCLLVKLPCRFGSPHGVRGAT